MNVFYEEGGKFKVATVVQKNDNSCQVDTQHGKRIKLKASQIFLDFTQEMGDFLQQANIQADDIDIDFLWAVAEGDEFTAEQLGRDYYGDTVSSVQLAALLIRIFDSPIYFYKKGKGVFKAAPEDALKAAKASIERKEQQQQQKQVWVNELSTGHAPEEIARQIMSILHQPDKQNLLHQAFLEAADLAKSSPLNLARTLKLVNGVPEYLLAGFTLRQFPKGLSFSGVPSPQIPELPVASVEAFSIDDESTTEVDDALSVTLSANGHKRVGIHIATPGIAIEKDSALERLIFERLSTVYYPGSKITMLPQEWIDAFSLNAGQCKPVLSLYLDIDSELNIIHQETKLEKITVKDNLRTQTLETLFNAQTITDIDTLSDDIPYKNELIFLYQFAKKLATDRGQQDSGSNRFDYSIELGEDDSVRIARRSRGAPVDLLVGEMMVYTNSHWAGELKNHQLPAIFRAQTGGKVRLTTEAAEHIGMGVPQYAWCTSPLRRACDYLNQKQLLSLYADYPVLFEPKDAQVFAVLRAFETTYASYAAFQQEMEFYYTLKYLQQEHITEFEGVYLKEGLIRASALPLVVHVPETPEEWFGKRCLFAVKGIDLWARTIAVHLDKVLPETETETEEA